MGNSFLNGAEASDPDRGVVGCCPPGAPIRVLIFGAGFLGTRLAAELPGAILCRADIADPAAVREALEVYRPDAVINAAAATGRPNVDALEARPFQTWRSNAAGPLVLAELCQERSVWLLHLGSGCIFYGPSPEPGGWREADPANPISLYARTKYAADLVLSELEGVLVLRLRMPIDGVPGPRNLISKITGYGAVVDVMNSVTVLDDLVHVVRRLLVERPSGALHATNPGVLSHRHLIARYQALVDPSHTCEFITPDELTRRGLVARPRSNAILDTSRLNALGISMRPVEEALDHALRQYARALRERGFTATGP